MDEVTDEAQRLQSLLACCVQTARYQAMTFTVRYVEIDNHYEASLSSGSIDEDVFVRYAASLTEVLTWLLEMNRLRQQEVSVVREPSASYVKGLTE